MPTVGKKTADKAVGRTRGGLNTKIHAVVDGLGNPVEFLVEAPYWQTVLTVHKLFGNISQNVEPVM